MADFFLRLRSILAVAVFVALVGGPIYIAWQFFKPVPEIGRGLSHVIAEAKAEFSERVAAHYVAPMPVGELTTRLRADGFSVHRPERYAMFAKTINIACSVELKIEWTEEGGIATRITGRRSVTCL